LKRNTKATYRLTTIGRMTKMSEVMTTERKRRKKMAIKRTKSLQFYQSLRPRNS